MTCDEIFEALARGDASPEKKRAIDAHLEGCEECRLMRDGLQAYDAALKNPGQGEKDPPHVKAAILKAAHAKADESRGEAEEARRDARGGSGPPAIKGLATHAPRLRSPPGFLLVAASLLAVALAAFLVGRLTAPESLPASHEDTTRGADDAPIGSAGKPLRGR